MKKNDPARILLSIIIPTLQNESEVDAFFDALAKQTYPRSNIEIIATDGGSTDKTVDLLKKHGAIVIKNPYVLAEPGVHLGMEKATGELKMILALDNFFSDKNALKTIVQVFRDPHVYAAVLKHDSKANDSLFTKYHNTFTDPFNHFINGYASNTRTFSRLYRTLSKNDIYDIYDFASHKTIPMMSFSQGFTVRSTYNRKKDDMYDDCAPVLDIIKQGKKIAYIHAVSIYHSTIKDYKQFIRKQRWATENAIQNKNYGVAHRFKELSTAQKTKMYVWPFYSLSVVAPITCALYNFMKDHEKMWLFHPVECLLCGYANGIQLVDHIISKKRTTIQITRK